MILDTIKIEDGKIAPKSVVGRPVLKIRSGLRPETRFLLHGRRGWPVLPLPIEIENLPTDDPQRPIGKSNVS